MSGGIGGVGVNPTNNPQNVETTKAQLANVVVQSHGQTVQTQPSVTSLVADAQEEAGMLLQDKSSEKLSKRDARSKSASRVREMFAKYLNGVSGVDQAEKFNQLTQQLKDLSNATPGQIKDLLSKFKEQSGDENFESAILLALEELFAAEGTHEGVLEAIREVKAELGEELRDFYENHIKSFEDISEVYEQLLGEYGEEDFLAATDAMITRYGDDLQSQSSSTDSSKVKATVDSLYHLEVARNTYSAFAGLLEKMQTVFDVSL